MTSLLDRLEAGEALTQGEFTALLRGRTPALAQALFGRAVRLRRRYYGDAVYVRGLIEFSNYCKNACLYCGIRRSTSHAVRYRLSEEDILSCCHTGYGLGFRTFVLQGGEDAFYTDEKMVRIIEKIKKHFPDCALTLSIGEKTCDSYRRYFESGADRYLLRHETSNA